MGRGGGVLPGRFQSRGGSAAPARSPPTPAASTGRGEGCPWPRSGAESNGKDENQEELWEESRQGRAAPTSAQTPPPGPCSPGAGRSPAVLPRSQPARGETGQAAGERLQPYKLTQLFIIFLSAIAG